MQYHMSSVALYDFFLITHIDYLNIKPEFHLEMVEDTNSGSITQYICHATLSVFSTLVWERLGESSVIKHVAPQPQDTYEAEEICQTYSQDNNNNVLSFTVQNSTLAIADGLVSRQCITLIVCEMKQSSFDSYRCVATSHVNDSKTFGPEITVGPSTASTPTPQDNVTYAVIGCVSLALITMLILLIILMAVCIHLRINRAKSDSHRVTYRKREENIYY